MKVMLDPGAYFPERAHATDAGLDLRTPADITVKARESCTIDTGVHVELPKGCFGQLFSKSVLNMKHGIVSLGGTIDEGYTGSIVVKLYNESDADYHFKSGEKIVQMVIMPYAAPELKRADCLDKTERGTSGFGSSGK